MNNKTEPDSFLYLESKGSNELVIVFSGVHARYFMGYNLLSHCSTNKLFIRDPTKGWYNGKISGLSEDANELKKVIERVTSAFDKGKITILGSSMGGYAALLFGLQLKVGRILVFSPQVTLAGGLPNTPSSLKKILYPDLGNLIKQTTETQIEYFFGVEEITDFYHIQHCTELSHLNIHCIINSPHNVMGHLHSLDQLEPLLNRYLTHNELPVGILEVTFWKNKVLLKLIIDVIECFLKNRIIESIKGLEGVLLDIPNWSGGWVFLAKMYRRHHQHQLALNAAKKSVVLNSQLDIAYHELGMVQFAYKNYDEAILSFKKAIYFASQAKALDYIKLCISHRECGQFEEAYKVITEAKMLFPQNYGMYFHCGKILELKSNFRAALSYYRKAHLLAPDNQVIIEDIEKTEAQVKTNSNKATYKVFCGGDTILTRYMHFYKEDNGTRWITKDLKILTDEANVSMLNLECVISNVGSLLPKNEYRPYHYRGAPELADILVDLNITVAFTANNHAIDFGKEALLEQKKYFTAIGIATPGSGSCYKQASQPSYAQVGDYVIATVSIFTLADKAVYAAGSNKPGVFHEITQEKILDAAYSAYIEARQHADLVIISPHWTQNWTTAPTEDVIFLAHAMIDMGYDAVLGHSSHLFHGVELYHDHPIVYDMGTLLADFAKGHEEMPYQAAFMLHVQEGKFNALEIIPIELKNGTTIIANGESAQKIRNNIRQRTEKLGSNIEFVRVGERLLVEFNYKKYNIQKRTQEDSAPPIFTGKFNQQVLSDWKSCKPNVLFPELEKIIALDEPIFLGKNGCITHIEFPESFYKGAGFLLQMVFCASSSFAKGRYDVHLKGVHENKECQFYVQHPVSQGVYNPEKWQKGEAILDRTVTRPQGDLKSGEYKLYIGFMNQTEKTFLHSTKEYFAKEDNLIYIGKITLIGEYRGNFASGLDWSGSLKDI